MADREVGEDVAQFLINNYLEDLLFVATISDNEILRMAQRAGVPCCIAYSSDELFNYIKKSGVIPDIGVLAWWPNIIKSPLLELPTSGFINFHPSYLPYNRGKHYNFWAIVEEAPFGVTLHFIDNTIDSGDIAFQKAIHYDWTDTGETLYKKAQSEIIRLFFEKYPLIRTLGIPRIKQDLSKGTFHAAKELDAASRIELDRKYTARHLLNLIRARTFKGYPACFFEEQGEKFEIRVKIKRVKK